MNRRIEAIGTYLEKLNPLTGGLTGFAAGSLKTSIEKGETNAALVWSAITVATSLAFLLGIAHSLKHESTSPDSDFLN